MINNDFSNIAPPSYQKSMEATDQEYNDEYNENREEKFQDIVDKYEINMDFAQRLQQLTGFKVAFIFDDSGSMNSTLKESPLNNENTLLKATRFDELKYFAKIAFEVVTLFDPEGASVYFLNKKPSPVHNVKNENQLDELFNFRPRGYTPLPRILNNLLRDNEAHLAERKLLILIATDGEPTNDKGKPAIDEFVEALRRRSPRIYTTIIACTDDDDSVKYLNNLDKTLENLDVVDDYISERAEVKDAKGANFPFSFGDYVVKSLIGSIDPELDNLDEKSNNKSDDCCLIL